jgi:hypothetical protein
MGVCAMTSLQLLIVPVMFLLIPEVPERVNGKF